MDNQAKVLSKLEALLPSNGFDSKEAAIEWTEQVSSLLKRLPNQEYYANFARYMHYFCLDLSSDLQAQAYRIMKSQLNGAINEIKHNLEEELEAQGKYFHINTHLELQKAVSKLISCAFKALWICDAYLDHLIIEELSVVKCNEIKILTNKPSDLFKQRLVALRKQFPKKQIEVRLNAKIHDRYFIIDEQEVWICGTSYNVNAGNKPTTLAKFEDDATNLIQGFNKIWDGSQILK